MPVNNGYPYLQSWNDPQIRQPDSITSDSGSGGSAAWTNPSSARNNDSSYASANVGASNFGSTDDYSYYLWATDFKFNIPTGATIRGIVAEFDKSVTSGVAKDWKVNIIKGGSAGSTNRADTVTDWGTDTNDLTIHGSETDLWGETWTPADINASNFGVAIAAEGDPNDLSNAQIDMIRLKVYYDLPIIEEVTFDGYVKAIFTESFTLDGYVKIIEEQGFTFDSYVAERYTKEATMDGVIIERLTQTVTLDGIIVERLEKTFQADAIIVERKTKDFTFDAIVVDRNDKSVTMDGIVVERLTKTVEYDAYVKGIQTKSFEMDGIIIERIPGGVFTMDAYLKAIDYYILDDLILPRPKYFRRAFVNQRTDVMTLGGRTGRDYIHRKEKFLLGWDYLTPEEITAILEKVELNTAVNFRVLDRTLSITDTSVIPYVGSIIYDIPGSSYYGRLELELIEES